MQPLGSGIAETLGTGLQILSRLINPVPLDFFILCKIGFRHASE
jgi:hypothetical protein